MVLILNMHTCIFTIVVLNGVFILNITHITVMIANVDLWLINPLKFCFEKVIGSYDREKNNRYVLNSLQFN